MTNLQYQDPIVLGELNANIGQYQNPRIQKSAALMLEIGMMELIRHFQQH